MIDLGTFSVGHSHGTILLARTGEGEPLPYSYAEGLTIQELLGIAASLESNPVLMPYIEDKVFRIYFNEDNTLQLERTDDQPGQVPFTWREIDKLITTIEEGIKMFRNDQQVGMGTIRKYIPPKSGAFQ